MQRSFNKYASIEIVGNIMKYRIETQEIGTEDPIEVEKDIKRKLQLIENQDDFLLPSEIQTINRYMVLYYNLEGYADVNYLREVQLEDKVEFYLSLVKLGQFHENGLHISWDKMNFVVDKYSKSIKALLFETDYLKIHDKPEDIVKTIKDFIVVTMTTLNTVIAIPKRNDFIFTDDANIQFVEKLYKLDSLDDIYMYLETVLLDIDSKHTFLKNETEVESKVKKRNLGNTKNNKTKAVNKTKKKAN